MLVAHRNGMAVWTNPYVTDGLVAMWDGEWNAGGGVHDASATTWANLVTGDTASLPSGFTVGMDCISVSNENQQLVVSDYSGSDFTVEYVFALADSNTARECLFESLADNNGFRFKAASYVQDLWNNPGYRRDLFARSGNVGCRHHIATAWTGIYEAGSYGEDYVDGLSVGNGTLLRPSSTLNGFRIGRTSFTTFQDVCCIRIYSRALTAAEIANNYAIDKARFSLP